ncbi:MAG: hypothetical protein PHG66_05495 [Candidatus Colwellbacteria bacterium]|nr:hypothetical protein [Candidatus Colwellbacteria bacterium]
MKNKLFFCLNLIIIGAIFAATFVFFGASKDSVTLAIVFTCLYFGILSFIIRFSDGNKRRVVLEERRKRISEAQDRIMDGVTDALRDKFDPDGKVLFFQRSNLPKGSLELTIFFYQQEMIGSPILSLIIDLFGPVNESLSLILDGDYEVYKYSIAELNRLTDNYLISYLREAMENR